MEEKNVLKKLQATELDILKDVARVCKKYNLTYMLIGGTLLGAVRHKGFIPWDDDIDIGMPRKDYEKFLKVCEKELSEYIIHTPSKTKNYYLPFTKIKKKNTLFLEKATHHIDIYKGIFIDVFPLDNVKKNNFSLKLKALFVRIISDTIYYKVKISKKIKNSKYYYLVFFLQVFPVPFLLKIQQKVMKTCSLENSKYLINFSGAYTYDKELVLRKNIFPLAELSFEGYKFKVPCNYDEYLTGIYGDYMKLPPKDKQVAHMPIKISFNTKDDEN